MTALRPYQAEAVAAVHAYWQAGGGNALIDLATGTGKSVVLAQIVRDVVEGYGARVVVATHVKELVEQDLRATLRLWPACPAGVNSAGLGRRDTRSQVLFASIQSIHRDDANRLGKRQLLIIDEAHLVPRSGDGMYLRFIARMREAEPDMRVLGLTATPYRLDSGRLDQGDGRIFDDVVYSYGIGEGVRDGYLSPLTARDGAHGQIDVSGVARRGGEFIEGAMQDAANKADLIAAACREIVERGQSRRGWIVFGAGVEHAAAIADCLRSMGVAAACVTGDTPGPERDRMIRDFKAHELRCLTSVGVLTTGFDAPHVDLIAMMRPTLSTGLYVQMLGRGTRLSQGKDNCLVLDFSGNVRRHGPVDAIEIKGGEREAAVKPDTVRAKACPSCGSLVALRTMECADCGHVWQVAPKHDAKAARDVAVMARDMETVWHPVTAVTMREHMSAASGNKTIRVNYAVGFDIYSEWLSPITGGWGQAKAESWWRALIGGEPPSGFTTDRLAEWTKPRAVNVTAIRVRRDGKYWRVIDRMRADGSTVDDKMNVRRPAREAA